MMANKTHQASDPATAAIEFALTQGVGVTDFLRAWLHGDFPEIREEWPEAPESIYIGADPSHPETKRILEAESLPCEVCGGLGAVIAHQNGRTLTHPCPRDCTPPRVELNEAEMRARFEAWREVFEELAELAEEYATQGCIQATSTERHLAELLPRVRAMLAAAPAEPSGTSGALPAGEQVGLTDAALSALRDAATSLETISRLAGRKTYGRPPIETFMDSFADVRAYAASRASVARTAIAAHEAKKGGAS